jgi:hypothetical protein
VRRDKVASSRFSRFCDPHRSCECPDRKAGGFIRNVLPPVRSVETFSRMTCRTKRFEEIGVDVDSLYKHS